MKKQGEDIRGMLTSEEMKKLHHCELSAETQEILTEAREGGWSDNQSSFQKTSAYLMCMLMSTTAQRSGVVRNLTLDQIDATQSSITETGKQFTVRVEEHKTGFVAAIHLVINESLMSELRTSIDKIRNQHFPASVNSEVFLQYINRSASTSVTSLG